MNARRDARFIRGTGCLLALLAVLGNARAGDELPKVVRDLHYGEILFYYYQEDYFSAITRLQAAMDKDQLPNHGEEAELLLGGLYLSYGQHEEAGKIFARLLEGSVEDSVRDRTWFYLAKIWYQRGYLQEAEQALATISGTLPPRLEVERPMLSAQILILDGRYDEAISTLEDWKGAEDWRGFVLYNLGVALIRQGRVDDGARLLDEIGTLRTSDPELQALRDKANLAVGYAYLQANQADDAKPWLQRVSLSGPFSNKALLGVGWADSSAERYERALVPWLELRQRDLLDPAVQESLLAIPYAFGKLDANRQAADHYLDAIEAFTEEMGRLERSIDEIRQGGMLERLLQADASDGAGWFWTLQQLPPSPETRYLYHLLARHEFQEALKSYRDLKLLQRNLTRWSLSVAAFDDMLETRQIALEQRLPVIESSLSEFDLAAMQEQRRKLELRLNEIERTEDPVGLATSREQRLWSELSMIERSLAALPSSPAVEEARGKQRLLKGVLLWDMTQDYKARLWRNRQALKQLDIVMREAQKRDVLVQRAKQDAPARNADYEVRIVGLAPRVAALQARVDNVILEQDRFLQEMAIDELLVQRQRLETYLVQARFSLAAIYDRSADAGTTP